MRLALVLVLLAFFTPYANAADSCGYKTIRGGIVFTLDIDRSFHPPVRFQLCKGFPPEQSFLLVSTERNDQGVFTSNRKLHLDTDSYNRIYALYDESLDFDLRDSTMGLDGSTWCLETKRGFTYSKSCFWSPDERAEERKLSGLRDLGAELWRLAEFKAEFGKMY